MLKCSHALVGRKISERYNLSFFNKIALIIGSVIPDCKISCFTTPHCRENWDVKAKNLLKDLKNKGTHGVIFYYKLGVLLHFYADFFTRPHSNFNMHYFKSGHAKWERRLHKELRNAFGFVMPSMDDNLDAMLERYYAADKKEAIDCIYISLMTSFVCEYVEAGRESDIVLAELPELKEYLLNLTEFPGYAEYLFFAKKLIYV